MSVPVWYLALIVAVALDTAEGSEPLNEAMRVTAQRVLATAAEPPAPLLPGTPAAAWLYGPTPGYRSPKSWASMKASSSS